MWFTVLYWLTIVFFGLLSAFLTVKLQKKIKNTDRVALIVLLINGTLVLVLVVIFVLFNLSKFV